MLCVLIQSVLGVLIQSVLGVLMQSVLCRVACRSGDVVLQRQEPQPDQGPVGDPDGGEAGNPALARVDGLRVSLQRRAEKASGQKVGRGLRVANLT